MSGIKYGLISRTDADCIEAALNYIMSDFPDNYDIHVIELGIYNGESSTGISNYIISKKRGVCYHAIDNEKDKPVKNPFAGCNLIIGNSTEVYNRFEDNSQHFIMVDADHSYIGVISDFYAYADKVKIGGFLCFHDTNPNIKPFKDFQHGDIGNPDAYISVRKALKRLGLLDNKVAGWKLIFDEYDPQNEASGVCIFKRINKWD